MKSVIKIFFLMFIIMAMCISVSATDSASVETVETASEQESITEVLTEIESEIEIGGEQDIGGVIDDIKEGKTSLTEAVILVAEKARISVQDAEYLLERALAAGDAVLGEKDGWTSFKASIEENREFWVVVILCVASLITILFGAAMFILKVKKSLDKIDIGTNKVQNDSEKIKNDNSQTLENLTKMVEEALREDEILKTELVAKNEKIAELERTNEELRRGMLDAEMYTLRILKLIYSRTNLPLADKSVLDLWHAQAESSLKSKMTDEDVAKHEEMKKLLKGGGKSNEKKV